MKQITADEFKKAVDLDPAWASHLTEPVEITEFCNMVGSKITHLSPRLHFAGRDKEGQVASFYRCKDLKVAEGNFHGFVNFKNSKIEQIGKLEVHGTNDGGAAASFSRCGSLTIAGGKFSGWVDFSYSGIEKIGDIQINQPAHDGDYADWEETPIIKKNPKSIVTQLWGNKSIPELREIQSNMDKSQIPLKEAVNGRIRSIETAIKKNAAVEIQID